MVSHLPQPKQTTDTIATSNTSVMINALSDTDTNANVLVQLSAQKEKNYSKFNDSNIVTRDFKNKSFPNKKSILRRTSTKSKHIMKRPFSVLVSFILFFFLILYFNDIFF